MPTYLDPPDGNPLPADPTPPPVQEDPYSIGLWPARPVIPAQPSASPQVPAEDPPLNPMIPAGLPTGPEAPADPDRPAPPGNPNGPADNPPSPTYGVALWHHFQRTPGFVLPLVPGETEALPPMQLTQPADSDPPANEEPH